MAEYLAPKGLIGPMVFHKCGYLGKVALLLIYLAVLFILARLLEAVTWYEQGQISRRLLDPMALSVLRLKALLEQRGVSYDSVVEKTELKQLVEASGSVNEEELKAATSVSSTEFQVTNYTGDADFYEQVEDAKDSMWLVEIITDSGMLLSDTSWRAIRNKVGKFGVRFGRFDCQLNMRLCARRQWYTSRLVLALPENYQTKANVALHTYTGPVRINALFDWMKLKVNEQIEPIEDLQSFEDNWISFNSSLTPEVRVVFMSTLSSVPLFLSALSVKFPGRVKMGNIDFKPDKEKQFSKKTDIKSSPAYLIITSEGTYSYGSRRGEILSFKAMEMFLKSFYPSMNDLFIISIICTNITSLFELSLATGTVFRRFCKLFVCVFKFNLVLLLAWILLITIFQLQLLSNICLVGLKVLRLCASTLMFSFLRQDIFYFSQNLFLPLVIAILMLIITAYIKKRYFAETDSEEDGDWWNFSNLRTHDYEQWWELTRLRPFDQIFNPTVGIFSSGEDVVEMSQAVISKAYIQHLPCWHYIDNISKYRCRCRPSYSTQDGTGQCLSCKDEGGEGAGDQRVAGLQRSVCEGIANTLMDSNYRCECAQGGPCPQHEGQGTLNHQGQNSSEGHELQHNHQIQDHTHTSNNTTGQQTKQKLKLDPFQEFTNPYTVESMNKMPHRPEGYIESHQCVICIEDYRAKVLLRGLPCGHVFHAQCIGAWLMRDNHFCPVCRWPSYKPKEAHLSNSLHTE